MTNQNKDAARWHPVRNTESLFGNISLEKRGIVGCQMAIMSRFP
jgi:hypothetical protein